MVLVVVAEAARALDLNWAEMVILLTHRHHKVIMVELVNIRREVMQTVVAAAVEARLVVTLLALAGEEKAVMEPHLRLVVLLSLMLVVAVAELLPDLKAQAAQAAVLKVVAVVEKQVVMELLIWAAAVAAAELTQAMAAQAVQVSLS